MVGPRLPIGDAARRRLGHHGWLDDNPAAERLLASLLRGPDPEAALSRLAAILDADPPLAADALEEPSLGDALVAITGASRALSVAAVGRTGAVRAGARGEAIRMGTLHEAIDPDEALRAIRRAVTEALTAIAIGDLTGTHDMPAVGALLSDTADAAADAAYHLAIRLVRSDDRHADLPEIPMAVVAMGKWGGRELNYASDIDVLFVYDVPSGTGDERAGRYAQRVAENFLACLADPTDAGVAYRVDADLRPEGRSGPLARTLESYRAYWERWAETWELQALLKARPAAGDPHLGRRFVEAAEPFVFPETLGADAVREVRSMKARAEALAERTGHAVELKRGVGGIRDVEFAVQLLQLVHGRSDPGVRSPNTLDALAALAETGYVRPEDAAELGAAYRWLRDTEHRIQLYDLRQTHRLPDGDPARERLAKTMGYRDGPEGTALARFDRDLVERRATVRGIHERLFYRPLLEAFADSPAVRLTPEGTARQLSALGFLDVEGARRAFGDLTVGLSRRSRLMQQMLPLMLDWLSEAPDPDLGLAQLRLLVTTTTDNAELISAMRDNPVAAERLCKLLGTGRLLGRLVDRIPPALATLGDDDALEAFPSVEALTDEALTLVAARTGGEERTAALERFAQQHLLWIAGRDLVGSGAEVGGDLTALADALTTAAFRVALDEALDRGVTAPPMAVIAMGKWGGGELNYASDLDALLVHSGTDPAATAAALRVAETFVAVTGRFPSSGLAWAVDLDLRPEGRRGPLTRSFDSYRSYYDRWAETWEFQSLIRARPVAGDADLSQGFVELIEPLVYRDVFGPDRVRAVRAMKARVEQERIPPGEDPEFHMKLGRGGMADVEWTVQLLQLRHGGRVPAVRGGATLPAIHRLADAGILDPSHAQDLTAAYGFCTRVRNRLFLQAGRPRDALPTDPVETTRLARSLGYLRHPRTSLREDYRRATRRARRVVEGVFYRT
jgi:glutamate-ammonia-ligase adenylyltransferase